MGKGLALDSSNDIIVGGTAFTRTSDGDYVAQKLRSKLQLVYGEMSTDKTAGIEYFSDVFTKPVDLPAVAAIFKAAILDTDGVDELVLFEYELDSTERKLSITFSVNTEYGDIEVDDLTLNVGA